MDNTGTPWNLSTISRTFIKRRSQEALFLSSAHREFAFEWKPLLPLLKRFLFKSSTRFKETVGFVFLDHFSCRVWTRGMGRFESFFLTTAWRWIHQTRLSVAIQTEAGHVKPNDLRAVMNAKKPNTNPHQTSTGTRGSRWGHCVIRLRNGTLTRGHETKSWKTLTLDLKKIPFFWPGNPDFNPKAYKI